MANYLKEGSTLSIYFADDGSYTASVRLDDQGANEKAWGVTSGHFEIKGEVLKLIPSANSTCAGLLPARAIFTPQPESGCLVLQFGGAYHSFRKGANKAPIVAPMSSSDDAIFLARALYWLGVGGVVITCLFWVFCIVASIMISFDKRRERNAERS